MKFENVSVYNIENAIRGMRNPMMSHERSDTSDSPSGPLLGPNDYFLAKRLVKAGEPHRKFLRQIFVSADITAPLYWILELDTYKVGTTMDCSSTMHKITSRDLTSADFEPPETTDERLILGDTICNLNHLRQQYLLEKNQGNDKDAELYFRAMKRTLPASYNYFFTWTANYEVLANIYKWRHNHRLPAWRDFCTNFIGHLPYNEFITGKFDD